MRQTKIIMHTHWDREWYFTKDETQTILRTHMYEVIQYLEANSDIKYILDGQSVMIDDFLEFAPDYKQRLGNLIANGQLLVGPWYTQTDLMLVHGKGPMSIIQLAKKHNKQAIVICGSVDSKIYDNPQIKDVAIFPTITKVDSLENTLLNAEDGIVHIAAAISN